MTTLREAAEKSLEMLEHFQNVTRIGSHDSNAWNHFHRERFMRADRLADETIISLRAALAAEQGEPTVWYCPECGSISDTESRCCPDWIRKRLVTKNFAESCQRTFRAALAAEQPQPTCTHEFVDIRNPHITSGEMCIKCGALRAGNAAPNPNHCTDCGKPLGSAGDIHTCSPKVDQ